MLLETERTRIRRLRESDCDALFALLSDEQVMRHIEPPYTRAQTLDFIRRAGCGDPPLVYAILEKESGQLIGQLIWHAYDEHAMELGWLLLRAFQGQGLASEITRAILAQADQDVVIECSPHQAVTRHIAEKCGFHREGMSEGLSIYRYQKS